MLALSLPFVTVTRPFTYEHSLVSMVNVLMRSGQLFLGIVVLGFAIFLPVIKLLYLVLLATLPLRDIGRSAGQLRALEWLGKWSLQDVLVLSLTIPLIRSQTAYAATFADGVYFFAAAVLLMMLGYTWLRSEVSASRARMLAARVAYSSTTRSLAFGLVIGLAAVLLALGAMLPAIRFTGSYAGTSQHSIVTVIWALYTRGEFFLCSVIFTLALLLPSVKLFYLLAVILARHLPYALRAKTILVMEWLGRHSTADVAVLALMSFYLNASGYSAAPVLPGAYLFAASALVTMLAYGWINAAAPAAVPQRSSLQARLAGLASSPPAQRRERAGG